MRPSGEAEPLRPLDAGTGFGTFGPPQPYGGDDDGGARTDPESEHGFEDDLKAPGAALEPDAVEAEFEAEIVRAPRCVAAACRGGGARVAAVSPRLP